MPLFLFILMVLAGFAPDAAGQDFPPAVPPVAVEAESLPAPSALREEDVEAAFEALEEEGAALREAPEERKQKAPEDRPRKKIIAVPVSGGASAPIVVELFSSQACVFCPKADALLAELSRQEDLIALDCHVDYFDVKTGALSIPFCSSRQAMYEGTLRAGPKYTPQMVINGQYNAVGYRRDEVLKALEKAAQNRVTPLQIAPVADSTLFEVVLGALAEGSEVRDSKIWLIVFDKPHDVSVAEGGNSGKDIIYEHIVSSAGLLGTWEGAAQTIRFDAKAGVQSEGFAVLVQDHITGRIIAAGQYLLLRTY